MAKVDWYGFAENFQAAIQSALPNLMCTIEEALPVGPDANPSATIFILGRTVPEDRQVIAANTVTRYFVNMQIWVAAWSLDGVRRACELRDDVISDIEGVLQNSDNWESFVDAVYLDGGELETAKDIASAGNGYYAGGTINFRVDATHTR